MAQGIQQLREAAIKAGRGGEKFIVGLEMFIGIGSTDDAAKGVYSATLMKSFSSAEEGVRRSLVGTTQTIVNRMELYENAGLDYFELKFMYSTVQEFHKMMETFAKDVIPSFR
jgi:alkanesulfonate monooxygenase SsuD/methylene tetrahydromethanopterin reductase-like flavin-dependent oxidoreductase (luciferase family)